MTDLAEQIRAWADAADVGQAVRAEDLVAAVPAGRPRRGGRVLVAAVLVLFVGALAASLLARNTTDDPTAVTTQPTVDLDGPVTFEVLSRRPAGNDQMGTLRAATTPVELAALWSLSGGDRPLPDVDLEQQVVVSITIPDDACPPTLERFDREGATLTPVFVEPERGCEEPLIPKTFLVALDRSTTGDDFRLALPGQPSFRFGDTHLDIDSVRPPSRVHTQLWLEALSVLAGGTIDGSVQVDNNTGDPLEGETCGSFFAVALGNDEVRQEIVRAMCLSPFTLPPGLSSYPVTVRASHNGCSASPTGAGPQCLPGGGMPPLPAGIYEATVEQASEVVPAASPITVTITER